MTPVPPPLHYAEPPGVSCIDTAPLVDAEDALDGVIGLRLIGAFTGTAGTGKTFALQTLLRARPDVLGVYMEVPTKPTMKSLADLLARELGGVVRRNRYDTAYELVDELKDRPDGRCLVIVFDEAQRMNNECAEFLRSLHDNRDTRFAMVFVGGDGCWDVLSREPMLISRVWEPVFFRAMDDEELLIYLPGYHRIYETADPALLLAINGAGCDGIFRRWSARTARILQLMELEGVTELTPEIAAKACRKPVDDFVACGVAG